MWMCQSTFRDLRLLGTLVSPKAGYPNVAWAVISPEREAAVTGILVVLFEAQAPRLLPWVQHTEWNGASRDPRFGGGVLGEALASEMGIWDLYLPSPILHLQLNFCWVDWPFPFPLLPFLTWSHPIDFLSKFKNYLGNLFVNILYMIFLKWWLKNITWNLTIFILSIIKYIHFAVK